MYIGKVWKKRWKQNKKNCLIWKELRRGKGKSQLGKSYKKTVPPRESNAIYVFFLHEKPFIIISSNVICYAVYYAACVPRLGELKKIYFKTLNSEVSAIRLHNPALYKIYAKKIITFIQNEKAWARLTQTD